VSEQQEEGKDSHQSSRSCTHHWRPSDLDYDNTTGRVYWIRYYCCLCPATYEGTGDGMTKNDIIASDPGPIDTYVPTGVDIDAYIRDRRGRAAS